MNEEIRQCYRQLELEPGAPPAQVKMAFHDLVKVWHPDRFAHDPVLQQKAQEKLKEINLAYEKLSALADHEDSGSPWEPGGSMSPPARRPAFGVLGGDDPLTSRFRLTAAGAAVLAVLLGIAYIYRRANAPPPAPKPALVKRFQGKGFGSLPKPPVDSVPVNPLDKLQTDANAGDPKAQFALGLRYENGDGVLIDKRQAAHWYEAAATNGLAIAQERMGEFCLRGKAVNEDLSAAVRWFLKAAEQGDPEAQCQLGSLYADGRGVPQNFTAAIDWYRKAAGQGHDRAQYELGLLNASGKQIPQNFPEAARWFALAAQQGNADAQYHLGELYRKGDGVEADKIEAYKWYNLATAGNAAYAEQARDLLMKGMTPGEILEAQKRSSEFKVTEAQR
jgi:TPR repeat protein